MQSKLWTAAFVLVALVLHFDNRKRENTVEHFDVKENWWDQFKVAMLDFFSTIAKLFGASEWYEGIRSTLGDLSGPFTGGCACSSCCSILLCSIMMVMR
jgi:hypothetical protein